MELTHDDVVSILELLERTDVEYLEVDVSGTRIVADRSGVTTRSRAGLPAADAATPPPTVTGALAAPAPAPPAPAPAPPTPASPAAVVAADLVTVPSPMVGVFFRAPEPGSPAFVEIGSHVEQGATLGLVEVMKMYNGVAAPIAGEVVEVLAANDEFVEYGQPLFRLRPSTA